MEKRTIPPPSGRPQGRFGGSPAAGGEGGASAGFLPPPAGGRFGGSPAAGGEGGASVGFLPPPAGGRFGGSPAAGGEGGASVASPSVGLAASEIGDTS